MAEILKQKIFNERVRIHAAEHSSKDAIGSRSAIYFFGGYALPGNSKAMRPLGRALREAYPDKRVVTLSARPNKNTISYVEEVDALREKILSGRSKNITIIGYSEATTKAISLAYELARDSQVQVDSLVLAAPLGITEVERPAGNLIRSMLLHIPLNTLHLIMEDPREWKTFFRALGTGIGVIKGIGEEAVIQGRRYPSQVRQDILAMSRPNPSFFDGTIDHIPTLIIAADNDNLVSHKSVTAVSQGRRSTRLVTASNGSHGFPFVQPEKFVSKVVAELSRMNHSGNPSGVDAGR